MQHHSIQEKIARPNYPWWVKLCIVGKPNRIFMYVSVVIGGVAAIITGIAAYWNSGFIFLVPGFIAVALMDWLTIVWIDRHGSWEDV